MYDKPDMAGLAGADQLRKQAYKDGAFYLGHVHPDHEARGELGIINPADGKPDDRHVFVMAGSRSGKGTSLIIPNLIRWPGPIFCIDPKGENAAITAVRRGTRQAANGLDSRVRSGECIGQNVAILDPFDVVEGPAKTIRFKVDFDPLSDIDPHSLEGPGQIESLVEALVVSEQGGDHWTESAGAILAGTIEYVLIKADAHERTLTQCRNLILGDVGELKEALLSVETTAGLARVAGELLAAAGDNEAGSFKTTLTRQLRWLNDPRMQAHLKPSGFSLRRAMVEGWSVYVVLPPSLMHRMKRWLRAIVRMALDAKMESAFSDQTFQTLFLLDEFPVLGHFQLIEESSGYMAGYGIKLVPVIQNIGQLKKHYGQNWETFLGNAGAIIAWGLNDLESEKYIADRIGPVMEWQPSYGTSESGAADAQSRGRESESENVGLRERPIRWPSEIRQHGAREHMRGFVVPASGAPFIIKRRSYMEDAGKGWFDSPQQIREWEKRHA